MLGKLQYCDFNSSMVRLKAGELKDSLGVNKISIPVWFD